MERINKESIAELLLEKSARGGLHVSDIAANLVNRLSDGLFFESPPLNKDAVQEKVNRILNNESKKAAGDFVHVKNPKTGKPQKGVYRLKRKKNEGESIKVDPLEPSPPEPAPDKLDRPENTNLFVGKAGECAVMSELLFQGYNVNSMLVDDGVDIVASKNNMFYYLQVKTTVVDDKNRIYATIRQKKFNDYIGTQIRYVVVARCRVNKVDTNLYFVFDNRKIQELVFGKKINSNQDRIYIKIEIDPKDNKPYIYDEKRECIAFYMNNFDL
ncbi:MAG: hypothetical protein LBS42_05035 [Tannerella sp.]|jgi:hypothetical protein|nr:hypothetical protein [Tannerella sp.]